MRVIPLVLSVFPFSAVVVPAMANPALQATLAAPTLEADGQALDRVALDAVYAKFGYEPLWVNTEGRVEAIRHVLSEAARHGLQPSDYNIDAITKRIAGADVADRIALDMLLTDGLLRYIVDVRVGRVSPRQVQGEEFTRPQLIDPVQVISNAYAAPDFAGFLDTIAPQSPVYRGLIDVLAKLRAIEAAGGWKPLPDAPKIEPGQNLASIITLRNRLAATGELGQAEHNQSRVYDRKLVEAVKAYQTRSGLKADGIIGKGTRASLNVSVGDRIRQTLASMERLRWQPDQLGERYVYVNVPAYQLIAASNGKIDLNMKVIVGRPKRPTPIFNDQIRMVDFNPVWHVPPTIAREDILPHLREDPTYALVHKDVHIYQNGVEIDPSTVNWHNANIRDYRLRAPPGPRNPLGTVKFLFPNQFDVYLHDTSEPDKFAEYERGLSSGCVRISDPTAMANWLLTADQPNWSEERRVRIMDSAKQTRIMLKTPVPVYLAYITAWLEDGIPVFRPDIYEQDKILSDVLLAAQARPRRLAASLAIKRVHQAETLVVPVEPVQQAAP